MPSASAKLEKQASIEASEPLKQITTMVEKKVRNLEKRKAKLDSYRSDFQSGKTLNEDQNKAVEKYDQVVEVLDFAKEMQKSFNSIMQETSKSQKKLAKRECIERQQQELQRFKEIVMIQDILNSMGGQDVRNDFLSGANGAVKLTVEELNFLDELFKLICPERDLTSSDNTDFEKQLLSAAEHFQALLDSKPKEVIGTTYKSLKDTIVKIHSCNYFNKSQVSSTSEEQQNEDNVPASPVANEEHKENFAENSLQQQFPFHHGDTLASVTEPLAQTVPPERPFFRNEIPNSYQDQKQTVIPEVLPVPSNLNFLQESQIDMESPHLEPATAIAHSVPAGFGSSFVTPAQNTVSQQQHFQHRAKEESCMSSHIPTGHPSVPPPPGGLGFVNSALPNQSSTTGTPADFDPNRPIPTQTYTNQSFSTAIHPMMAAAAGVAVPPNYVPVTLAHPMQTQHILPATIVAQSVQQRNVAIPPSGVIDSSPLPNVSAHNQPNTLSVTSAVSKMSLGVQEAKEHFVGRDFQMPQVSRESHLQMNKTNAVNSQFERHNAHEGFQSTNNNNNQSYMGHDNFSSDNTSYSSNLKRGLPQRGVARGGVRTGPTVAHAVNRTAYRN